MIFSVFESNNLIPKFILNFSGKTRFIELFGRSEVGGHVKATSGGNATKWQSVDIFLIRENIKPDRLGLHFIPMIIKRFRISRSACLFGVTCKMVILTQSRITMGNHQIRQLPQHV